MSDCVMLDSCFTSLNQRDYGIKVRRCAFERCIFPDRFLNNDPKKDGVAAYRTAWNTIEDDSFYNCEIAPSFLFGSLRSTFVNGASTYASNKPLEVQLVIGNGNEGFIKSLKDATTSTGSGTVTYRAAKPIPNALSSLWRIVSASW